MSTQFRTAESPRPIIVWDTETTGLGPSKNSLVEIGLMELECCASSKPVYSFSSLIHPKGINLPRAASRIHGITNLMMQDAPEFSEVWAGVREYVEQVRNGRGNPILIAHNLGFDLSFLKEELRRINEPLPEWDFACSLRDVAKVIWPDEKGSLAALTEKFSIVNEEAHRALNDVDATSQFLGKVDDFLRDEGLRLGEPERPYGFYIRELIESAASRRALNKHPECRDHIANAGASSRPDISDSGESGARSALRLSLRTRSFSKRRIRRDDIDTAVRKNKLPENQYGFENISQEPKTLQVPLQQYYLTPTGVLWHSFRSCSNLDSANAILRTTQKPFGRRACFKCCASFTTQDHTKLPPKITRSIAKRTIPKAIRVKEKRTMNLRSRRE